ncbi:MAG TPA: ribonuclease P protein component [Candidatus Babeliales bacterium]|jgi:ribonuclease P protein component|nr:ribonuclease P protein component [Candidatus Babeliales bacterium]
MPGIVGKISKFTKKEIDYLFEHARRVVRNQFCTILVAPRQKEDFGRVLIVVSRAVGNAPERNLIRRRIKSIFYEEKLFTHNVDCVVIAYKKMVSLSFEQLKDMLVSAYQKI